MKTVWEVAQGEYSDRDVVAVCSTEEQAMGVAIQIGHGAYVGGAVDLWEPEDGIPPYKPVYTVIVRPGADSTRPLAVTVDAQPIAVDAPMPAQRIVTSPGGRRYPWARAENYPTAEEGESAAAAAFEQLMSE